MSCDRIYPCNPLRVPLRHRLGRIANWRMARIDPKIASFFEMPGALIAESGLQIRDDRGEAYRCDEQHAIINALADLWTPAGRSLDPERLCSILRTVAARHPLPAVPVFRRTDAITVLDDMHRFAVASALGFTSLPCLERSFEDARDGFRYPDGQL